MFNFIADAALGSLCVIWTLGLAGACGLLLLWHTDEDVGMRRHLLATGILLCGTIILGGLDQMVTTKGSGTISWLATFLEASLLVVGGFAVLQLVVLGTAVVRWTMQRDRRGENGPAMPAERENEES
jgi:hypothetical protein